MTASERQIQLDDGAHTVLESWGASGPIVLCVHGITSSRRSWVRFAERVAGERRIFAFDQRGHGDSASVHGPMNLERSVADLAAVAAALPGPVDVLMGHSWGGAVVLLGGLSLRPKRVVAIDPMIRVAPGTFETEYVDDLRDLFAQPPNAREAGIREMYDGLAPVDVAAKLHAMTSMSIDSLERLGRDNDVDGGGWDLRERLVDYPIPLLVLAAGIESVMSADDLRFLGERGGPNVRVRTFPNDGHNLHRTAFDEFVGAVTAFA